MKRVPELSMSGAPLLIEPSVSIVLQLLLHRFLSKHMSMRLSDVVPLEQVEQVLDVACGPGSWVLDMAYTHRDLNFFGIDRNPDMIQYARTLATSA